MAEVIVNPHRSDESVRFELHDELRSGAGVTATGPLHPDDPGEEQMIVMAAVKAFADAVDPERERWKKDPVGWALDRGVAAELWSKQREILESLRDHHDVAAPTCHTIGKDFTASVATCWWLDVHEPGTAFVVTTAPTGAQVKGILWRYINRMHEKAGLPGRVNLTEWYIGRELVAIGRKPSEYTPDAFQGFHARYMLVIIDEACGVPETLWDSASTLTSNEDSRTLAIGNPDDPTSKFAQVCTPGSGWHVVQVGAQDTPNFTGEPVSEALAAELISKRWVEKKAVEWGTGSPLYVAKIEGKFPQDTEDGIVPMSFVSPCRYLSEDATLADAPRTAGLDVSESHDRTVLFERVGDRAGRHEIIQHRGDAMSCVGRVVELINEWGLEAVTVDVIGLGWGVFSRLRELSSADNPNDPDTSHSARLQRFHAAERAYEPERFENRRAELWWEVGRERSRTKRWDLTECNDDVIAELTAPKYFLKGSKGRIIVESKDEIKKRLGRSPDLADALLMAFVEEKVLPPAKFTGGMQLATTRL